MSEPKPPFYLCEEELRDFGYQIVELIVEHQTSLDKKPVSQMGSWKELSRELRVPFPEGGQDPERLLKVLAEQVFPQGMVSNHPKFMGFIPSPANPVSAFVEALVASHNPFMGAWHEASGPTAVELNVLDWLGSLIGYFPGSGGQITSGGTAASLVGLAAARHHKLQGDSLSRGRVYLSSHTHGTIRRNLWLLGFQAEQVQEVDVDEGGRIDMEILHHLVMNDRAEGLLPFCCVGTAGTTNTGAVDPLSSLADLCQQEGMWLHVDAAYGGASLLTEEGKGLLRGIERADSVVIDGHKWLFQPFELGCIVVREASLLEEAFEMEADYTKDLEDGLNLSNYGLQLSRSFKALKLWFTLRMFGQGAFREAVQNGLDMARRLEALLRESPRWDVVTPAQLGIVTFRHRQLDDEGHRRLIKSCWESGRLVVSSTILEERVTLRACPIHPALDEQSLEAVLADLDALVAL